MRELTGGAKAPSNACASWTWGGGNLTWRRSVLWAEPFGLWAGLSAALFQELFQEGAHEDAGR